MNQTDLSLIDAHITVELQRLQKLFIARNMVYQDLPAGSDNTSTLNSHQDHLYELISLSEDSGSLATCWWYHDHLANS